MSFWLHCTVLHSFIFLVSRSIRGVGDRGEKTVHRNFLSFTFNFRSQMYSSGMYCCHVANGSFCVFT